MGRILVQDANGDWVPNEPISADLVAAASTDQVVAKKSDGTLYLKTVSGGGGGATVLYDSGALASAANSIDTGASGIAGGYDLLEFWLYARVSTTGSFPNVFLTFNGDTGSNYDRQHLGGRNTGTSLSASIARANIDHFVAGADYDANNFGVVCGTIPFYAATTGHKVVETRQATMDGNTGRVAAEIYAYRWRSTAAINQMTFAAASGQTIAVGSRLIIYGR